MCLFCKIIKKEIPAKIIYENEKVLAFEDIEPVAPFHILIIPKEHINTINDLDDKKAAVFADMMMAAKNIATAQKIKNKSYRLIINAGEDAGQTVFHIHMHMIAHRKLCSL
ncbi:MAG: histidine triad nucleotide-binding protein [Gammaproteobacteria bacterium]|nr:MAG: histidine triad nucleotide-binding protein [Gammaproteobacteria bacterium]